MNKQRQVDRIEHYETQALELGDLKTAIKLNWLRNAVKSCQVSVVDSVLRMQQITLGG